MEKLFFELIQVTLRNRDILSESPSEGEWETWYQESEKQSLTSVLLSGLERLPNAQRPPTELLLQWIGGAQIMENQNEVVDKRCVELQEQFRAAGFRSCVLKGQGTAQYYEIPKRRQCGDIDLWVEGDRDKIIEYTRTKGVYIGHVDIKHSDMDFFPDVPVEIHFMPSWMYNPKTNRILQLFFSEQADEQFDNFDKKLGFSHTTVEFDLVFSIVHIYRHIFSEGIGLRQLIDYYYILQHSTNAQRLETFDILHMLKMGCFVGGVMWILQECFGMKEQFLLCPVNEKHGRFLLNEIMIGGNFGHFDNRRTERGNKGKFKYGLIQFRKNLRYVFYYPSEVLWSPFWKTWHYFWRKRKGYL